MIENVVILMLAIIVTCSAKNRYLLGLLVVSYYGVYIAIEFDTFGLVVGDVFTTHDQFIVWYLIYTSISFLFFIFSLIIYTRHGSRTAFLYACWIFFNIIVSGISAILQSFETNSFVIVYNVVQNINLVIDLLVVVIGTDNPIRKSERVTNIANYFSSRFDRYLLVNAPEYNKGKKCH